MKAIDNIFNLLLFHDSYYSLSVRKYILVESRVMQRGFSEQTLVFTISFYHLNYVLLVLFFLVFLKTTDLQGQSDWANFLRNRSFYCK